MKALILRQNADAAAATSRALMDKGFQILCVETLSVAHALIRVDTVDLLVMDERVEGQLTHAIALSGERRNPYLSTILLTDRPGEDTDDLYALIPCLYALAGMETSEYVMGQLALSAVSNVQEAEARVARRQAEEETSRTFVRPRPVSVRADDCDLEPSYADIAIARPAMAKGVVQNATPLERIDQVLMAQVAAAFRNHADKTGLADVSGASHEAEGLQAAY